MTGQEKIITPNLEQKARDNPDKIFERVFLTIDFQNPDKSRKELTNYVEKNKVKGRVGYLSELNLTGKQILYLGNQSYIKAISLPDPQAEAFRASDNKKPD